MAEYKETAGAYIRRLQGDLATLTRESMDINTDAATSAALYDLVEKIRKLGRKGQVYFNDCREWFDEPD